MAKNNTTSNPSKNSVRVSGNITRDAAKSSAMNFAAFDVAHNGGKNGETMFDKVLMYNKNGKTDIEIPFDILVKGKRVLVEGYRVRKGETYTDKDGQEKTATRDYIVALQVTDYPFSDNNPSVNEVEVSGNLYADCSKSASGNFAGFDMAHNAGKKNLPLSDKVKMFGGKDVEIPFDVLTKGARVLVKGYRRAVTEEFTAKDGAQRKITRTYVIAKELTSYPWKEDVEETPTPEENGAPEA